MTNQTVFVVIGMLVCLLAGFLLALSMNLQSYALTCPDEVLGRWSRTVRWSFGIFVYILAQGCFVVAISLGPFGLMSSIFTTCLIFDQLIAYFTIKQVPKPVSNTYCYSAQM
jgi:hypothetical protein